MGSQLGPVERVGRQDLADRAFEPRVLNVEDRALVRSGPDVPPELEFSPDGRTVATDDLSAMFGKRRDRSSSDGSAGDIPDVDETSEPATQLLGQS